MAARPGHLAQTLLETYESEISYSWELEHLVPRCSVWARGVRGTENERFWATLAF